MSPTNIETAFDQTTRGSQAIARESRRVLVLFSGAYRRPDSLASFLHTFGYEAVLVDNDREVGGGKSHDVLDDKFYSRLSDEVRSGHYCAIFAAPPCSTFCIGRTIGSKSDGPPAVRDRSHIHGLPGLSRSRRREVTAANAIVARTCALLALGISVGCQFIIENPVDRGDRSMPESFLSKSHGPLWLMPEVLSLQKLSGASSVHCPQCLFGSIYQKRTTFMYSPGFERWMAPLRGLRCTHSSHVAAGGQRDVDGIWNSRDSAAYPPALNLYLARAISSLHSSFSPSPSDVHDEAAPQPQRDAAPVDEAPASEAAPPAVLPPTTNHDVRGTESVPFPDLSTVTNAPADDAPFRHSAAPPSSTRPTRSERLPTIAEERPSKVWGTRREFGSPLVRALRSHRGLLLVGDNLLQITPCSNCALLASKSSGGDPRTRSEALAQDHDGWTASMNKEIDNHEGNGSYVWMKESDVPANRKLIKLVWVFKTKRDGTRKSRLCVQGCCQTAGVDFNQTFSAALRSTSLRFLASIASRFGLRLRRWDFVSAYLQGSLEDGEVVYCHAPPGYERCDEDGNPLVCRVVKPIYGMAQAGRRWQRSLFPWLKEFGFTQCDYDSCMFYMTRGNEKLYLGCYVDDLAIAYDSDAEGSLYSDFVRALQAWKVEDEGEMHDLLGVEFSNADGVVEMKQTAYITKLVNTYLPDGVPESFQSNKRPCNSDLAQLVADALSSDEERSASEIRNYQSLVGALLYCATNTRPDVAYSVGMLCRAMAKPTPELMAAAQRVLMYLYRTRDLGLRYECDKANLFGMTDSDWAVKHSTSGYVFKFCQAAISWASKKQPTVALSSCEAEIMAASEATKEAVYLSRLSQELGVSDDSPLSLHCDNRSATDVAYNPEHFGRMKHVERRHFYVRECVENHLINVPFVRTDDNIADFFTKALESKRFFRLRDSIMNIAPEHRACRASAGPPSKSPRAGLRGGVVTGQPAHAQLHT